MDELTTLQAASFGHTLFVCARLLDEVAQARVNREAGRTVLRPALTRLLPFLTPEGVRVTDLARRADVTKQAVSQTLVALEAEGVVALRADPDDARAKRVHLTRRGRTALGQGVGVLAALEAELKQELGARVVDDAFRALAVIRPVLERWRAHQPDAVAPAVVPAPDAAAPPRAVRAKKKKPK